MASTPRLLVLLLFVSAAAHAEIVATYLGNEGVLVTYEDHKVLFDPLYRNSFDIYELVPDATKAAIITGSPPFDGVTAVFISHYHEDHFSAEDISALLNEQPDLRLYAPAQAVAGLLGQISDTAMERVVSVDLEYGEPPLTLVAGVLNVSAVRIPHSGWPTSMTEVQNIAYRVTLDSAATVSHFGDADTRDDHYAQHADHWAARTIDLAFPPYWYFSSAKGRHVLTTRLKPRHSVGVHVPVEMPDNPAERPQEFQGYDLFTEPGQTRRIAIPD